MRGGGWGQRPREVAEACSLSHAPIHFRTENTEKIRVALLPLPLSSSSPPALRRALYVRLNSAPHWGGCRVHDWEKNERKRDVSKNWAHPKTHIHKRNREEEYWKCVRSPQATDLS